MTSALPPKATVIFPAGLPGFERCRRFVLMYSEEFDPGVCLKSLDAPEPAFFLIDPRRLASDYQCQLSAADRARLGTPDGAGCVWLVMVSWQNGEGRANLGAPIVINPATMRGIQVVPAEAVIPVDASLSIVREAACLS